MSNEDIRYFLYARKSSEGEDRQIQSIPDQVSIFTRIAEKEKLILVDVLTESKSAKTPDNRDVFASMVRRIEAGEANGILTWNANRLFRNPVDGGKIRWLLQEGIIQSIRTIDREFRPSDNSLLLAVEEASATQQVRELSVNVRRGLHEKAARGCWPTQAKPGYRNAIRIVEGKEIRSIEPDPERFALLRKAWDLMLTGAYSVPQVLAELNGWGYRSLPTRGGGGCKPMTRSAIYRLFDSPFYSGRFFYGGDWRTGTYKPMITQDEFNRVQDLIKGTNRIPRQKQRFAYTGLIRCGVCGCQITAERKVKHYWTTGRTVEYVYYRCTGRRGCPLRSVSEEYLTRRIFGLLSTWRIDDDARTLAERAIEREEQASYVSAGTVRQTKEATRQDLERRLNSLYVMRENEEISSEEFVQRKKRYADELGSIDQAIARTGDLGANNARAVRQAVQYLNDAPPKFPNASLDEKREIASVLAASYVLTLGKFSIRPDPTLLKVATLEPLKTGSHQVGGSGSDPESPSQRRGWDAIRSLLTGSELSFEYRTTRTFAGEEAA
ncbi:MAG: recombinase family protein [Armatimonadetes bacterium]|nr:recombinase family protein [Armatimonadota bacterium]